MTVSTNHFPHYPNMGNCIHSESVRPAPILPPKKMQRDQQSVLWLGNGLDGGVHPPKIADFQTPEDNDCITSELSFTSDELRKVWLEAYAAVLSVDGHIEKVRMRANQAVEDYTKRFSNG